jgi:ABC-type amino acid transport substrate-binding protein
LWTLVLIATVVYSAQARSLEEIKQSGGIRFCVAPYGPQIGTVEPPDCLGEQCQFQGPVRALAEAFAQSLGEGIETKYRILEWDEQFHNEAGETVREQAYTPALMASGTCDVYPSWLVKNDWRLKKLAQLTVYPSRDMVFVHQSKKDQFKQLSDLAGKLADIIENSSQHSWLDEQNKTVFQDNPVRVQFSESQTANFEVIDANKADFTITGPEDALWEMRHHVNNSVAAFPVGSILEVTWGFRKEDQDLQAAFGEWITAQQRDEDSVLNKVWKDTFGLSYAKYIRLVTKVK